jgi:hypothetical protein
MFLLASLFYPERQIGGAGFQPAKASQSLYHIYTFYG